MKKSITIGKYRGLQATSSQRGVFAILALDHRQNLRKANPEFVEDGELSKFKLDVVRSISSAATAVLLDPEVSAAQSISEGVLPGSVGLVVAGESTGYTGDATARQGQIIPGWSVQKAKRMGANALKLLVYYHPDSETAKETEEFVAKVGKECAEADLSLMLEPLSYSLTDEKLTSEEKQYVVTQSAKNLTPLGVDLLKAEFPLDVNEKDKSLWEQACTQLSEASFVPWILLSAAVDFEVYMNQVITACHCGASGIAVGRAVWKEAVQLSNEERMQFLNTVARQRLSRLKALCDALAHPFTEYYSAQAPLSWFKDY